MKPSQIAQIIVRLFALTWFLYGIVQTAMILAMRGQVLLEPKLFMSGAVALVLATAAWWLAPTLGRRIAAPETDQQSPSPAITFQQLLYAMFIGIGLYFALSSVGGLLSSLHFHLVLQAAPKSIPAGMHQSVYDLSKSAITFVAGISLILAAPYWSQRLSKKNGSHEGTTTP